MALVHPAIATSPHPTSAGEYAERNLVLQLSAALSDNYLLFHHVDWSRQGTAQSVWMGELDLIVVNGHGDLVVIELKTGQLSVSEGRLFKDYGHQRKDVIKQFVHQRTGMRARLNDAHLHPVRALHLLVLPDFRIQNPAELVGVNPTELVDAGDYAQLEARIRHHLPECPQQPQGQAVQRFLMNWLQLVPDIDFRKHSLDGVTRQLADGLATWVPRITSPSGLYLINATAGCGKTQMSLDLLDKAAALGQRALYLCYNRPLADRMRSLVSSKVQVSNYDELCMSFYRRVHGEPDFADSGVFTAAQQAFLADPGDGLAGFDLIMVDEAQDFEPDWVAHLLETRLSALGRAYVLQDEDQRIYPRDSFALSEAVSIVCDDNFRSPQNVVALIHQLKLSARPIRARSALPEGDLHWFTYHDEQSLLTQTAAMIRLFMEAGYKSDDILLATGRGKSHSLVLKATAVGPYALRRFTGQYDRQLEAIWTPGDIDTDTIYRAKGQSAPVVILTELDFEAIDDKTARLLFVGLTRASMGVGLVLTQRAQQALLARMG